MEAQLQTPAPVVGASLLRAALSRQTHLPERLSSGSAAIDDQALGGGFRYGEITAIAGAHGTGKTTVRRSFFWIDFMADCAGSSPWHPISSLNDMYLK